MDALPAATMILKQKFKGFDPSFIPTGIEGYIVEVTYFDGNEFKRQDGLGKIILNIPSKEMSDGAAFEGPFEVISVPGSPSLH